MRRAFGGLLLLAACYTIETRPRSPAPINDCTSFPCDRYERGSSAATCNERGLCNFLAQRSNFYVVVHVPQTSSIGAGLTFAVTDQELLSTGAVSSTVCKPPNCLLLPRVGELRGSYRVSADAAVAVGLVLDADKRVFSIPVRATLQVTGRLGGEDPRLAQLPFDELFASSEIVTLDDVTPSILFSRPASQGLYRRYLTPQEPFVARLPPIVNDITLRERLTDDVLLCAPAETSPSCNAYLDHDPNGEDRTSTVTRLQGLDGFEVWLEEDDTGRRISAEGRLSGTSTTVELHTSGRRAASTPSGLDKVSAVVEPPRDAVAVPRYVSPVTGGIGFGSIQYPPLPPPVSVNGFVASPTLTQFAARVTLRATGIYKDGSSTPDTRLQYETMVVTNEEGRFTTVLPPGTYDVRVEGLEGSGYGRKQATIDVPATGVPPFLVGDVPLLTRVRGRATLTDGRPVAGAEVLAQAVLPVPVGTLAPRPGRSRTNDRGEYVLDLDEGAYDVSVIPQDGSGFPRVVTRRTIPAGEVELSEVRVPPPSILTFAIFQRVGESVPGPTPRAIVRIFRRDVSTNASEKPVEIGQAMADANGRVEILLAE